MLGPGRVKGQRGLFPPYRLLRPDQRQLQVQTLRENAAEGMTKMPCK